MQNYARNAFEIMAPVGSQAALHAAIEAGADAVYFGVEKLNMRSRSANPFTVEDLAPIVQLCHSRGVKAYLTLNTVIYDEELELMRGIAQAAARAGVDAVIASDAAVMVYCRSIGLAVHLSTQLNISNVQALRFYAQFADVVVLARELNLGQVARIAQAIETESITGPSGRKVRIEMFCHGALCMAVSGKCYLSLDNTGHSANRGDCLQLCRRAYLVRDQERNVELAVDNQYIMSPKDLKTIDFMEKMVDSGVRVFKIEGRARGADYVHTVVTCYRQALEAIVGHSWSQQALDGWNRQLATVFNRGFWDGYYLGQPLGEWTRDTGSLATEKKVYAGRCLNYFAGPGIGEFLIEAAVLHPGDKLLIIGPTTGAVYFTLEDPRCELERLGCVNKGTDMTCRVPVKVRLNDKLYRIEPVPAQG